MDSRRGPSSGAAGARPARVQSALVWGGLTSLLFLAVVWLVTWVGHVRAWSGPDLLVTMAVALALGVLGGLGVYWQWSLAETCGAELWRQVNETGLLGAGSPRSGEVE